MLKATHAEIIDVPKKSVTAAAHSVIAQLPGGAPFYQPRDIGPLLGITDRGFTYHCRNYSGLNAWRGSYRFYRDDPDHMLLLVALVKRIIWSGRKLPPELRIH